jgi:hypothetical protein
MQVQLSTLQEVIIARLMQATCGVVITLVLQTVCRAPSESQHFRHAGHPMESFSPGAQATILGKQTDRIKAHSAHRLFSCLSFCVKRYYNTILREGFYDAAGDPIRNRKNDTTFLTKRRHSHPFQKIPHVYQVLTR